jgi:SAM-dependent methyltransferase
MARTPHGSSSNGLAPAPAGGRHRQRVVTWPHVAVRIALLITFDAADFVTQPRCPSCRNDASFNLEDVAFDPPEVHRGPTGLVRLTDYVRKHRRLRVCSNCGLWYYAIVPHRDAITRMYDTRAYSESLIPSHRRWSFRRALASLERYPPPVRTVLDVGAASGEFLCALPGWVRDALEPTAAPLAQLNFADHVYVGYVDDTETQLPANTFGAITMFDVLEHVYDADAAFRNACRSLRRGGLLIIETGDVDSRPAQSAGSGWYYVQYLAHFVFFARKSMELALQSNGFELLALRRVHHSNPTAHDVLASCLKVAGHAVVTMGGRRPKYWRSLADATQAVEAVPTLPWGDHCFVVARKR